MRIAIVNDMNLAIEALRRVITARSTHEIAWIAHNGAEAVQKCALNKPDLILMDLIMPVMDGVQATYNIMQQSPVAILVVTSTVSGNSSKVFDAMGYGALDAVCTPAFREDGMLDGAEELLKKIDTISMLIGREEEKPKKAVQATKTIPSELARLIAIGSSTGGPKALATLLSMLPSNLEATIIIVQHVDSQFAAGLAQWLSDQSALEVMIANEDMYPKKGIVYIAGTNDHLVLNPGLTFHYTPEPLKYPYRPSVDTFFQSLIKVWRRKDMAILLTGMGSDGAKGLLDLKNAGWMTIAQDRTSSVVYGMPKVAAELGAAQKILPIDLIAPEIIKFLNK